MRKYFKMEDIKDIFDYNIKKIIDVEYEAEDLGFSENFALCFLDEDNNQITLNLDYDTILNLLTQLKLFENKE